MWLLKPTKPYRNGLKLGINVYKMVAWNELSCWPSRLSAVGCLILSGSYKNLTHVKHHMRVPHISIKQAKSRDNVIWSKPLILNSCRVREDPQVFQQGSLRGWHCNYNNACPTSLSPSCKNRLDFFLGGWDKSSASACQLYHHHHTQERTQQIEDRGGSSFQTHF